MIADTGPFVAAANSEDPDSERCQEMFKAVREPMVVPALVIAEAGFLIERDLGPRAEARFLRSLAHHRFRVEPVTPADLLRMAELVEQYADLPLGSTDASIVALAERLGQAEVGTLDHRHFTVVRPRHVEAFTLLP